jgi:hypothetical protein
MHPPLHRLACDGARKETRESGPSPRGCVVFGSRLATAYPFGCIIRRTVVQYYGPFLAALRRT